MKIDIKNEIKQVEKMQGVLELLQSAKRRNIILWENVEKYEKLGFFHELKHKCRRELDINEMAIDRIEEYYLKIKNQKSKIMKSYLRLLLQGARMTGSFVEGFNYVYEDLYTSDPIERIIEFCQWIDNEIGGAGSANIEMLWDAFNEPQDEQLQYQAMQVRDQIQELRRGVGNG